MIFAKLRNMFRTNSLKPATFVWSMSIFIIVLSWPLPIFFNNSQFQLFDIPFIYFYIILIGPALILFVTNWAIKFADRLDRYQIETEND